MDREGPNVQLHIQREVKYRNGRVSIRHGNKWVHLNRCKEYYSAQSVTHSTTTTSQKLNESVHLNGLERVEAPEVEDSVLNILYSVPYVVAMKTVSRFHPCTDLE